MHDFSYILIYVLALCRLRFGKFGIGFGFFSGLWLFYLHTPKVLYPALYSGVLILIAHADKFSVNRVGDFLVGQMYSGIALCTVRCAHWSASRRRRHW